jgi:hypothetical protein
VKSAGAADAYRAILALLEQMEPQAELLAQLGAGPEVLNAIGECHSRYEQLLDESAGATTDVDESRDNEAAIALESVLAAFDTKVRVEGYTRADGTQVSGYDRGGGEGGSETTPGADGNGDSHRDMNGKPIKPATDKEVRDFFHEMGLGKKPSKEKIEQALADWYERDGNGGDSGSELADSLAQRLGVRAPWEWGGDTASDTKPKSASPEALADILATLERA